MAEASSAIRIHVFGRTDVGQIREHNEDNFLVADLSRKSRSLLESDRHQVVGPRGTVLGVCDGMGGAAAGEVASQLAVDIIYEKLTQSDAPADRDDLARRLVQSVEDAGMRIFNEARADRTRRGMGTTATIAALLDGHLFVAQVGDSRAYILRQGTLVQVTRDQSLVNQLIEAGQLTEEEAETFEHNNIILQALGTADTVQVDLTHVALRQGDVLMVCSDGLSGMIRADEMREVLTTVADPLEACKVLTERANLAGGHDNITVIVARFEGESLPAPTPSDVVKYTKYALPDASAEQDRASVKSVEDLAVGPLSDEAQRESRRLKVSHTMVGMTLSALEAEEGEAAPAPAPHRPLSNPPPVFNLDDEPVQIPTTGLPPSAVGFLVVGALLVVSVIGFFLLR
ncbi:MAG: Stp1/IreP family PP2C-type Ser/Thr phosphatase [Polyangiaceae bacterium]|nr:Stp1/IreP family PP2C-type Ser/Thr phosphatase [Myxococcales bacterium]MCC6898903.1 Stp1/IreP family PP2C-type Ser/Thr phosphatase [Polyangiaceae bacterium]